MQIKTTMRYHFFSKNIYFNWRLITLQYCSGLCHTLTWISHGCTWVPHPDPPSHLPPHPIPQGHPSAPALSTLSHASNLDWWSVSHVIIYMFRCSLKSSHDNKNDYFDPFLWYVKSCCQCVLGSSPFQAHLEGGPVPWALTHGFSLPTANNFDLHVSFFDVIKTNTRKHFTKWLFNSNCI